MILGGPDAAGNPGNGVFDKLMANKYAQSTIPGKRQMDGDPHESLLPETNPYKRTTSGLPMGTHVAAMGAGMGQALMGGKMAKAFNAGAGGYQDLYRQQAYLQALAKQGAKGDENRIKREGVRVLTDPGLEAAEKGLQYPYQGGK